MKKTSVYLDPKMDRDLGRFAAAEGKSRAEVIREALADWIGEMPPQPRITAIGVFTGPGDLSQNVDRYLEGFGED
ncbi:MAG: ribbon-helix-helix domain-containing protein [Solirubrobacterales bacterium]